METRPRLQGIVMVAVHRDVQSMKKTENVIKLGTACKSFPALLHTNGLAQTIAFFQAKGESDGGQHYKGLLEGIAKTLCHCRLPAEIVSYLKKGDWIKISELDRTSYQLVAQQTMMIADYYKRYAEILLPSEKN